MLRKPDDRVARMAILGIGARVQSDLSIETGSHVGCGVAEDSPDIRRDWRRVFKFTRKPRFAAERSGRGGVGDESHGRIEVDADRVGQQGQRCDPAKRRKYRW